MKDYLSAAQAIKHEINLFREDIHAHPELGNSEFRTAERIENELGLLGIDTKRLTDTAVLGILRMDNPGRAVAFRADMDALPLEENTGADCASVNKGVMHACGHDIHTASLLCAAKLLVQEKSRLRGEVRFMFQPDEEGNGGAQRMVKAGALEGVSAVFGGHVEPGIKQGKVGVRYGKFYAASDMFDITVNGVSSHGAEPEKGIDALAAAAELVTKLKAIPSKLENERCVVTTGTFAAGTARNILAGTARLSGIMRTLGSDTRLWAREQLTAAISEIEAKYGVSIDLKLTESYPGVVNDNAMTALAEETAKAVFGADNVEIIDKPNMTTEDFGCFLDEAPGTFVHIGVGGDYPLHNPRFFPDVQAALNAGVLYAALADRMLSE